MGAPDTLQWRLAQASARRRLRMLRVQQAGNLFAFGSTCFTVGVLCARWFA